MTLCLSVETKRQWTRLNAISIILGMSYQNQLQKFSRAEFLPEGWFWLLQSQDLKTGQALPVEFYGRSFVAYRGEDGNVRLMDAHCPHMGAHLCDGSVEGNHIRCPFHYWKFDGSGQCIEIPAQNDTKLIPSLKTYKVQEAYGLIWLWTGDALDNEPIPVVPELVGYELDYKLGTPYTKNCHPNVMMINAIDAQHFRSVHQLVVDLDMETRILSKRCVQFSNVTPVPHKNFFLKWAAQFYQKSLTYEMTYWWGHTGSVMVGPDFLHFYIIFATRPTLDGKSEGQTILVTKKRKWGFILNPVILFLTKLVGDYFAKGDTIIFSRIKFAFNTPIRADRAIINFAEHYETQKPATFGQTVLKNLSSVSQEVIQ